MLYDISFQACIGTLAFGGLLGLAAIWMPERWRKNDVTAKLMITDGILFVTSLAVAIVTKLLG